MTSNSSTAEFWDGRYRESDKLWSGRPNAALVATVGQLTAGTALDLGAGEGGDALWLAHQGWHVTAVDVSSAAVERGRGAARDAGLHDTIDWRATDLATWQPLDDFDLVSACFFQSPLPTFDREGIVRRIAGAVKVGGHVLLVSHGAVPPWADHAHHHEMPSIESELALFDAPGEQWDVVVAEHRERAAIAPDGSDVTLDDLVVLLHRH